MSLQHLLPNLKQFFWHEGSDVIIAVGLGFLVVCCCCFGRQKGKTGVDLECILNSHWFWKAYSVIKNEMHASSFNKEQTNPLPFIFPSTFSSILGTSEWKIYIFS